MLLHSTLLLSITLSGYAVEMLAPHQLRERRSSSAVSTLTTSAFRPQATPSKRRKARDVDQGYLHALADHLEDERTAIHAMMTERGVALRGTAIDPAVWDVALDGLQREGVALLKHDYPEAFSPTATATSVHSTSHSSAAPSGADTSAEAHANTAALVALLAQGITLSDRYLSRLRHVSTRDLARRVRTSHSTLIKELRASAR